MMRIIGILVVMTLSIVITRAETIEKMTLKNGSVLEGYLSKQRPGKDLVFIADKSTLEIPSDKITSLVEKDVPLENLSQTWQAWLETNPGQIKTINDKKYVTLCDIFIEEKIDTGKVDSLNVKKSVLQKRMVPTYNNVRIIERGKFTKFLDCSNVSYHFTWDKVRQIERMQRDKKLLSGLVDEYYLRNGRIIKGQLLNTVIGEEIQVLDYSNILQTITLKEIGWHKKSALNPDQPMIEQAVMLDVIRTVRGDTFKGLVVNQNYGTEKEVGYLSLLEHDGNIQRINVNEIAEMDKLMNDAYKPLEDLIVKPGEIYLSRKLAQKALFDVKNEMNLVALKSPVVELSLDSIQNKLIVEQLNELENKNLILFKLVNVKVSRVNRKVFTFEDLLMNGISASEEIITINNTLKLIFPITEKGDYILYRTKKREGYYCKVK